MSITVFHVAAWIALAVVALLVFLVLFEPGLPYRTIAAELPLDSHQFLGLVTAVVDAQLLGRSRVEVLTDGRVFYESELQAIRAARHSIHIEAFVFRPGHVSERFLHALTERARVGVAVRLVIDAIGSAPMRDVHFRSLRAAGGQVFRYYPIRWSTLKRFNNVSTIFGDNNRSSAILAKCRPANSRTDWSCGEVSSAAVMAGDACDRAASLVAIKIP